jgi:signal transduction histidine kinase/DNA-binding response OmpR family regulator
MEIAKDFRVILIAEDSPTQAEHLRHFLEQQGYQVVAAKNGREALELMARHKPHLLISDIVMPEMDGYELCQFIRSDPNLEDLPVIFLSVLSDPADIMKSLECGADGFIVKPFKAEPLLERIRLMSASRDLRKRQEKPEPVEVAFHGKKYRVKADRLQIMNLLVSTYEATVEKNSQLLKAQTELQSQAAELAAQGQELQRLASFSQMNPQPIVEININGRITYYNQAALAALGKMGKVADLKNFFPDDLREILATAKQTGEKHFQREVVVNGAVFFENIHFAEQFKALRLYAVDITERQRQEEERQKLLAEQQALTEELTATNEELATQAEELTLQKEELEKLNDNLRSEQQLLEMANEELESFSYSVSHDLKTPVRAIEGFSRMLLTEHAGKLDAEGHRLLQVITTNTQLMHHFIDDLLALSRLGRWQIRKSVVNLNSMARQVFEQLRAQQPERNLQLILTDLPPGLGDQSLLYQVMQNLLGNAVKFTGSREAGVIEVGGRTGDKENIYYVKDNGVGFDERYASNLFRPFQRLHICAEYEGTGIGLAIVKRIIQRHGGRVWAEGQVGEGATFFFSLPFGNGDAGR